MALISKRWKKTRDSMDWFKGKFTGKSKINNLMRKSMASCGFSLKPIHLQMEKDGKRL